MTKVFAWLKMKRFFIIAFFIILIVLIGCKKQEAIVVSSTKTILNETGEKTAEINQIKCRSDEDCGGRIVEEPYCFQGNSFGTLIMNKCLNPNTKDAYCSQEVRKGLVEECAENQFCQRGECRNYENCTDADGGKNYAVAGEVRTNDGAVYEDVCRTSVKLIEYFCSSDNRAFSEVKSCNCEDDACK